MSQSGKSKGIVRIYYQFPPKGSETSPNQVTLEQVKKYLSSKPLRRGPKRRRRNNAAGDADQTDPRPDDDQPRDSDAT